MGFVRSVNVAKPRTVVIDGRRVRTAIAKQPVAGPVALHGVNLDGDGQAARRVHGGPDAVVYAYASEDLGWWSGELGRSVAPGAFGENLTVAGIDVTNAHIGERWRLGATLLEVTSPRVPCFKLAHAMDDPGFIKRFAEALRPGAYLRVIEAGTIAAGDAVDVVDVPNLALTIADLTRIRLFEPQRAAELLDVPGIAAAWRAWAEQRAAATSRRAG